MRRGFEHLFAQRLDLMDFREEPSEDHQLLATLDHIILQDVRQCIQLPPAHQLGLGGFILHQKAAGELLEAQEPGQDGCGRDSAAAVQLCIAVPPEPVVQAALFCAQGNIAALEGLFREVEGFFFGHPVGDAVFLLDQPVQVPIPDDLPLFKAAHHAVPVFEGVEVQAKNRGVEESVLTEDVDGLILHRRSRKDELVPGFVPQLVHGLALGGVVCLDALALISYDEVGIVVQQGLEDSLPPCGFVVDHGHLQVGVGEAHQIMQFLQALRLCPQHRADGVRKSGIVLKLFRPYGADACGGHNQHPLDLAHLVPGPGHRYCGESFATAHLEKKAEALSTRSAFTGFRLFHAPSPLPAE